MAGSLVSGFAELAGNQAEQVPDECDVLQEAPHFNLEEHEGSNKALRFKSSAMGGFVDERLLAHDSGRSAGRHEHAAAVNTHLTLEASVCTGKSD